MRTIQVTEARNRPNDRPIAAVYPAASVETGEMHKAADDFTTQVGRGQRGSQRSLETAETHVVRLIPLPGIFARLGVVRAVVLLLGRLRCPRMPPMARVPPG